MEATIDERLEQLAKAIERQGEVLAYMASDGDPEKIAEATKSVQTAVTGPGSLFGGGGVFSTPGLEPDVITAYTRPYGLVSNLDWFPSVLEQPLFGTITGFTGTTGSEPTNPCDNPPAGFIKGCNLTAQFGRYPRATQTIEFDKVMRKVNSGVTSDLVMRGRLLGLGDVSPAGLNERDVLNIYTMSEMVTVGANIERLLVQQLWSGNPANNTAGGGYMEFPGLERQIATGQVDANTGVACAALDSDVKDFNYNEVCGTGFDIVEYLAALEWEIVNRAETMGLSPTTHVIAMRKGLWQVLSECWPCAYNTNRCAAVMTDTNAQVQVDGFRVTAERDRMRRSMTIDINGNTYPVVVDVGITEENSTTNANLAAGEFSSSIFMIPLTITGGWPVTYMEHVDYRAGARDVALLRGNEQFWTDRGRYSWAIDQQLWCYELALKIEPRVVLRAPQLAGRIDNILYSPLQHEREPFADSSYFFDGGVSLRSTPSVEAVWLD